MTQFSLHKNNKIPEHFEVFFLLLYFIVTHENNNKRIMKKNCTLKSYNVMTVLCAVVTIRA